MNNLDWFGDVIQFCKLSVSCASCPYYLFASPQKSVDAQTRICFTSKEALEALSNWLSLPPELPEMAHNLEEGVRWLQGLIRDELHRLEDEDEFEDDFWDFLVGPDDLEGLD
ncbi:MAG TPA: hypothetical protein VFC80_03580 [Sphaerochaeta sp.]|nr:hypothetical protein [Sphaerochaeta sp.]